MQTRRKWSMYPRLINLNKHLKSTWKYKKSKKSLSIVKNNPKMTERGQGDAAAAGIGNHWLAKISRMTQSTNKKMKMAKDNNTLRKRLWFTERRKILEPMKLLIRMKALLNKILKSIRGDKGLGRPNRIKKQMDQERIR